MEQRPGPGAATAVRGCVSSGVVVVVWWWCGVLTVNLPTTGSPHRAELGSVSPQQWCGLLLLP